MKKNYQRPQSTVVYINTLPLLSGSEKPNVGLNPNADPINPNSIDSRRRNIWGDDEDYE